jgi:hypothetical protein
MKKISEEHLLPKWLKKDFPTPERAKMLNVRWSYADDTRDRRRYYSRADLRNGLAQNVRVKSVCQGCNNGWMSRLEEKAKPILSSLMHGSLKVLDAEVTSTLAIWAVLKSIVADALEAGGDLHVSQALRATFMESMAIPEGWRIWIGRSHVKAGVNAHVYGRAIWRNSAQGSESKLIHAHFIIGELYLLVWGADTAIFRAFRLMPYYEKRLKCIWPQPDRDVDLVQVPRLTLREIELITDAFRHHLVRPVRGGLYQ